MESSNPTKISILQSQSIHPSHSKHKSSNPILIIHLTIQHQSYIHPESPTNPILQPSNPKHVLQPHTNPSIQSNIHPPTPIPIIHPPIPHESSIRPSIQSKTPILQPQTNPNHPSTQSQTYVLQLHALHPSIIHSLAQTW